MQMPRPVRIPLRRRLPPPERGRQPPHRDELSSPRRGQSAIVSAAQSDHQPRPQAEVTPTCPLCTYSLPQTGLTWGSDRGGPPTSLPLLTSLAHWGSFPWGLNRAQWVGLFPLSLPVRRASGPIAIHFLTSRGPSGLAQPIPVQSPEKNARGFPKAGSWTETPRESSLTPETQT